MATNPSMPSPGPWLILLCAAVLPGQVRVEHHLAFAPGDEKATVRTTVHGVGGGAVELAWPRWQPGAHPAVLLPDRGTARVAARGGAHEHAGTLALCEPRSELGLGQRERYEREGGEPVRYYEGYALAGATTFPMVAGHAAAPQKVTFSLPPGFAVHATQTAGAGGAFAFPHYRALAETTFHLSADGESEVLRFEAAGRRYRVHLTAFRRDRTDRGELQRTLQTLVECQTDLLGPAAAPEYAFLFGNNRTPRTVGHPTGCAVLTVNLRWDHAQLLGLGRAHLQGWFAALDASELTSPPARPAEWFLDGVREYLAELTVVRAGLLRPDEFWKTRIASRINTLQRDRERLEVTVVDAGVRRFETRGKGQPRRAKGPDPRGKGLLLGLLLDVEIRARTSGRRSLGGALQALAAKRAPVDDDAIRAACTAAAGGSLDAFFSRYVHGTEELPLTASLARVGVRAMPSTRRPAAPGDPRLRQPRAGPPRWRVEPDPDAGKAAVQLREGITGATGR